MKTPVVRRAADPQVRIQRLASDEEMMKRFVHELRYSRKITAQERHPYLRLLVIQGNYAISMEYLSVPHAGRRDRHEKNRWSSSCVKFGIDIATGMAVAIRREIVIAT